MTDASFIDPSTENWGGDIYVQPRAPKPAPAPMDNSAPSPSDLNALAKAMQAQTGQSAAPTAPAASQPSSATPSAPMLSDADVGITAAPAPKTAPTAAPTPKAAQGALLSDADLGIGAPADAKALTNNGDESYLSGLGKGIATGAIKGLGDAIGFAGNLDNLVGYLLARGEHAVTGEDVDAIMARAAKNKADQQADAAARGLPSVPAPPTGADIYDPILAKTGEYTPDTWAGKLGQAGVQGMVGSLGPGGGSGALKAVARQAPALFGGAVAGQAATDVTGDPLLGMAAGGVATAATGAAAHATTNLVRPFAEDVKGLNLLPGVAGSRERMAGEELLAHSSNPDALRAWADGSNVQDGDATQVIPGSKPTLGQATGDMGLLAQERAARTANVTPFNEREAQQNSARRAAIASSSPDAADTMRPAQLFSQHADLIDTASQHAVDQATDRAKQIAARLGPKADPELVGATISRVQEAVRAEARKAKAALYRAVDPDGSLNIVASPVRTAAEALNAEHDPHWDAPRSPDVARVIDKAAKLPDVIEFSKLGKLEDDVTKSLMAEKLANGESPAWRQLSILKGAIAKARDNAVENQAAHEAKAVAAGTMSAEDTTVAKLQQWDREKVPSKTPLQQAEQVLDPIPDQERPARLAYLEQRAKREGALPELRALREYRAKHYPPTSTRPPQAG
jgi:hypothetical protein